MKKKEEILEKLLENEKKMIAISKNYKLSKYFNKALKYKKYEDKSENNTIFDLKTISNITIFEELSKLNKK